MGLLDAAECPPTFNTDRVVGVLAGGFDAFLSPREAVEDDETAGARDMDRSTVSERDAVVGVTASGRTPYTIGAVRRAGSGAPSRSGVVCNPDSVLSGHVEHPIEVLVGAEVIAGSTRLKAGTAQKIILNTISTVSMVKLGKTFGNLMVDLRASNDKLRDRARRIVLQATGSELKAVDQRPRRGRGRREGGHPHAPDGQRSAHRPGPACRSSRCGAAGAGGRVRVIGLISGTSMDGIDVAVADLELEAGEIVLCARSDR